MSPHRHNRRARRDGDYYSDLWRQAAGSGAHVVSITSYNEWCVISCSRAVRNGAVHQILVAPPLCTGARGRRSSHQLLMSGPPATCTWTTPHRLGTWISPRRSLLIGAGGGRRRQQRQSCGGECKFFSTGWVRCASMLAKKPKHYGWRRRCSADALPTCANTSQLTPTLARSPLPAARPVAAKPLVCCSLFGTKRLLRNRQ